jgi:Flp pilus assembly protein CpaB
MAAAPTSASPLSASKLRDKANSARLKGKKANPVQIIALVAVLLLCASGVWRAAHQTSSTKMVKVLAAAKDIPSGSKIGFMMLRYIDIPRDLRTRDMVVSLSAVVDHQCRTFLSAGEPIRSGEFFGSKEGISANLTSNERAITLQLSEDEMVDHAIAPDDLVDVISLGNKDGKKYAKTICQAARVLTVAPREQLLARRLAGASNRITLAVSPEMSELVSEAAEMGKVRLVLRGRSNRAQEVLSGSGIDDLIPASVLKEEAKAAQAKADAAATKSTPTTDLPPPPPLVQNNQAENIVEENKDPIGWVVQMISGSKKESISVPQN